MHGPTESITLDLARLALDAASLRHQAIAHNIANVNTPGFAPARVNFEEQLGAVRAALADGGQVAPALLAGVRPVLTRAPAAADADRTAMLDLEVADLAQNTVQYEALMKALGKHLAILNAAVSEGKK
ncbi:MAG: flagellar basal body rod protein FlgB [Telluria sp.]